MDDAETGTHAPGEVGADDGAAGQEVPLHRVDVELPESGIRTARASANSAGVVDALRIPDWIREPAERAWREAPPVVRLFLGLAVLDVLGRAVGLLAPHIDWSYLTPLSFVSAFVPHVLWIALPAILLLRRPDARTATPLIFWGAVVIAVDQFASTPIRSFVYGDTGESGHWALATFLSTVNSVVVVSGWVVLGRGLVVLTPRQPQPSVAGLSNIALGLYGLVVILGLGNLLTASSSIGDPALDQLNALNGLVGLVPTIAWAYLVWLLIRGLDDPVRPGVATVTAAAGASLAAVGAVLTAILSQLFLFVGPSFPLGLQQVLSAFSWLAVTLAPTIVLVTFALGLADPPFPYVPPTGLGPEPRHRDGSEVAAVEPWPGDPGESPSAGPAILTG